MGKLLYKNKDDTIIKLIICESLIIENNIIKIINNCVIQSLLDTFKLNEMLIS